ncbi:MAG TPA: hypothetical protein VNG71_22935 [Pyrinomonadaceae bacterium]|nr:hypothetical protein [Pyrinomonadaceae bacterium]
MAKSMSFDSVQADGETLVRVWDANPNLALGDITRDQFKTIMTGFVAARATANDLRTQLTAAVNAVNNQPRQINDICVRGRAGSRAQFGQDSTNTIS